MPAPEGAYTSNLAERTPQRVLDVHVLTDSTEGETRQIGRRPLIVGSDPTCDIVLDDPTVSRKHARLTKVPAGLRVQDLGSTNGIRCGGLSVSDAVLPPGSTLALGQTMLKIRTGSKRPVLPSARQRFGGLRGDSRVMREVFTVLELASHSDASVLLQGESGTGKELAASAVHDHSARADKPYVVIDCGALTEDLMASHLFGHVKGAFTGAVSDRKGAFVEADGGTVFIDEIGELSLKAQAQLLRVLEDRTVQSLGGDRRTAVETRIVAATHRDLHSMVREGSFRLDLYYRLAVVHLLIPPLRERLEDLVPLIHAFYEDRGVDPGPVRGANLRKLREYSWPGNVRELRNVLERAWVMAGGDRLAFNELAIEVGEGHASSSRPDTDLTAPFKEAKAKYNDVFEVRYLSALLDRTAGNLSKAAERAGLSRNHLRDLMRKHGLERT